MRVFSFRVMLPTGRIATMAIICDNAMNALEIASEMFGSRLLSTPEETTING